MSWKVTNTERETALEAARMAVRICRRVRADMVDGDKLRKDDRSPVTVADYAAQAVICRVLSEQFPDDPIIAEEESSLLAKPEQDVILNSVVSQARMEFADTTGVSVMDWIDRGIYKGHTSPDRFWTLDPIDGTKGFLRGEQYAVALALVVEGDVVLGLLACPYLNIESGHLEGGGGTFFGATKGGGAWASPMDNFSPRPIRVSRRTDLEQVSFLESVAHADHDAHARLAEMLGIGGSAIRIDSQAKYGVLAAGLAEIYLRLPTKKKAGYREKIWDHAAGSLVVQEAGGTVTDTRGKALEFTHGTRLLNNRGLVVSSGPIHDQIIEAVGRLMG